MLANGLHMLTIGTGSQTELSVLPALSEVLRPLGHISLLNFAFKGQKETLQVVLLHAQLNTLLCWEPIYPT